ncbi:hypothetical protein JCM8097_007235 [Rhodosporidiobolus ruineniae]
MASTAVDDPSSTVALDSSVRRRRAASTSSSSSDDVAAALGVPVDPPAAFLPSGLPGAAADEEEPVCRICLDGDDESTREELGRLFVPCKCSGTARFVHEECLRQWRHADLQNAFYKCGQCGYRYRFRQTKWTRIVSHKRSSTILAILIVCLVASVVAFVSDPLMKLTEEDQLNLHSKLKRLQNRTEKRFAPVTYNVVSSSPKETVSKPIHPSIFRRSAVRLPFYLVSHVLPDFDGAGNALRETTSMAGFALGDCRWASTNAVDWREETLAPEMQTEYVKSRLVRQRAERSRCGEAWGYETDQREPSAVVRAVMYVVKGLALRSLAYLVWWQLVFKWLCIFLPLMKVVPPSLHPPINSVTDLSRAGIAHVLLVTVNSMVETSSWVHKPRLENRLFSFGQVALVLATLIGLFEPYRHARDLAVKLVKQRLASVENLVLDIRDAGAGDAVEGKKSE